MNHLKICKYKFHGRDFFNTFISSAQLHRLEITWNKKLAQRSKTQNANWTESNHVQTKVLKVLNENFNSNIYQILCGRGMHNHYECVKRTVSIIIPWPVERLVIIPKTIDSNTSRTVQNNVGGETGEAFWGWSMMSEAKSMTEIVHISSPICRFESNYIYAFRWCLSLSHVITELWFQIFHSSKTNLKSSFLMHPDLKKFMKL